MIIECAFGQLKGRWSILMRKCECEIDSVKLMGLGCIVLHNLCIKLNNRGLRTWDLSKGPNSNRKRPQEIVRELLQMRQQKPVYNRNPKAERIRDTLKDKFWIEHETGNVS